ncbi:gamma-glutamyl-gamma-aminobutyrate hydrolase family protein [Capillimicrobium parvum]|uniref:Glutamine amidotransferase n=1 Tax=Capillimicrobium parvum TaxID=2884022 RepID=A0A9E7C126_9ACTN|nr:gamma-glutamyl-gamma-aminobutyrate hydrolase family protein [Capillimicrobium parvum]UGS35998.1 Putative glutamine amidotransferase [Capillimicrobium parvum]
MPHPRIAITAVPRIVPTAYGRRDADTAERGMVHGVVAAGGTPIILPVVAEQLAAAQLSGVDGLVLSGGQDLDATLFGAEPHPSSTWLDAARDRHEIALWKAARAAGIPVLGICRGLQLAVCVEGGDLEPHLDGHNAGEAFHDVRHRVRVTPGSRLAAILGSGEAAVNTLHHQAVRRLPAGWRPVAVADDGLVEGAEPEQGPWFVGIQWHPELMLDQPAGQAMFDGLVAAAAQSSPAQSS